MSINLPHWHITLTLTYQRNTLDYNLRIWTYIFLCFLLGFSYSLKMLGPAIGYGLASFCLKLYISPTLNPTITNTDPRWLGAWWLGWIILAIILFVLASLLALFPKTLPRAAARKELLKQISKISQGSEVEPEMPTSFRGDHVNLNCQRVLTFLNLQICWKPSGDWCLIQRWCSTTSRRFSTFSDTCPTGYSCPST